MRRKRSGWPTSGLYDTLCLHSDTPGAVTLAQAARRALSGGQRADRVLQPLSRRSCPDVRITAYGDTGLLLDLGPSDCAGS